MHVRIGAQVLLLIQNCDCDHHLETVTFFPLESGMILKLEWGLAAGFMLRLPGCVFCCLFSLKVQWCIDAVPCLVTLEQSVSEIWLLSLHYRQFY